MKIDAIIIGQNYSTNLGLIKAIGEAGYNCGVVKTATSSKTLKTPELRSKYVRKFVFANKYDEQDVLAKIMLFACDNYKRVLLPADDYCALFIDNHINNLNKYFYTPNVNHKQSGLANYFDKALQQELVIKEGLKVPETWQIDLSKTLEIPDCVKYPCITKPQISIGSPKSFIRRCKDPTELNAIIKEIVAKQNSCKLLIEQFIEIENEYTVSGVAFEGQVLLPAFMKKTKTGLGIHKGVTIAGIVKDSSRYKTIKESICAFVNNMGFEGIFDVELLESNGKFYFNEINLRYGAAGYAVTRAGCNLPASFVNYCLKSEHPSTQIIQRELSFVSDKAALDNYSGGYISWKEYKKLLHQAEVRFIDHDDMEPYLNYVLNAIKIRFSKIIQNK